MRLLIAVSTISLLTFNAHAQDDAFCQAALTAIPYNTETSFSEQNVDERVHAANCYESFETEEQFSQYSDSTDAGASYKLFSGSYGRNRGRTQRS